MYELMSIRERSALPEAVFGLDVGFHIPIQLVLALVVLLILCLPDLLHLLVIIVVQLIVCRFLLSEIDAEVFCYMVLLDSLDHFLLLQELLI